MSDTALEAVAHRRARPPTANVENESKRLITTGELRSGEGLNEQSLLQRFGVTRGANHFRFLCAHFAERITPSEIAELEAYAASLDEGTTSRDLEASNERSEDPSACTRPAMPAAGRNRTNTEQRRSSDEIDPH